MTIQRLENVGIVVDDLAAATTFFVELGLKVLGEGPVEGGWVDRVVGLEGVRVDIAMLETSDGHGRLELMKFHAPPARGGDRNAPPNTLVSAVSHLPSMTSTPPSPGCKPAARSSLVGWSATKTVTGSATSAARRGSSSCLRSRLAEGSGR
jgi:Glyoxalase/Bleomycin resistance protein/Dioxygenase superfamily